MSFSRQNLLFREVEPSDLPMLRELRNIAWAGYRDPTSVQTIEQEQRWYLSLNRDNQAFIACDATHAYECLCKQTPHTKQCVDAHRARCREQAVDPVAVGLLRFGGFDRENRAVIITGVDVFPEHRSKGYAIRIMRAAAEYMLHDLGYHRIVGECTAGNIGMKKAMEKAGYVMEGVKRSYIFRSGCWHDFLQYSLLDTELWQPESKGLQGI